MPVRAVLFDVGGPIDTETVYEQLIDQQIAEALRLEGIEVTAEMLATASERAVHAFAPRTYAAMLWELSGQRPDIAERALGYLTAQAEERDRIRGNIELRDGIAAVISGLHGRGYRLGLAANQPTSVIPHLEQAGIRRYFDYAIVSGHHGFRKPDVRLFLHACEGLAVDPSDCLMIGDRIDCDIVPARLLGMRTILMRTGRHIAQQPRSMDEVPDAEVQSAGELQSALERMLA